VFQRGTGRVSRIVVVKPVAGKVVQARHKGWQDSQDGLVVILFSDANYRDLHP
jgi:hypothetical protein